MKKIAGFIMAAGLLLLVSCGPKTEIEPIRPTGGAVEPTDVVVPTCTPEAQIHPQATETPEPAITKVPTPMVKPTVEPQPTLTPVPTPTIAAQPTEEPEPAKEATPTAEPEETPEPTKEPQETPELTPELTPEPTPSPTPAINPELLVNFGWQKTITIDEKYSIVFPEMFRESKVIKDGTELLVTYTCAEEPQIAFCIAYRMLQPLEEAENAILSAGGTILEGSLGEKRVVLEWQEDGMIYRGILSEEQYSTAMLGTNFGEEEWITGVMQITLAYPEERREEFETAAYQYFIKQNREE